MIRKRTLEINSATFHLRRGDQSPAKVQISRLSADPESA
ncbi:MAG: hypothetical protein ANABAC_0541 [Anaerolineae bacterium]|nr:MAG: hypothetical protein ANABAC_0541 [Anaerolineae bacterium]